MISMARILKRNSMEELSRPGIPALYEEIMQAYHTEKLPFIAAGEEKDLIHSIQSRVNEKNGSNILRTEGYHRFHSRFPEVHWALLAHLVSRNGGYSMTDLKSSYIGPLLNEKEKTLFFQLLERINASIFLDAYPQLLLYEESRKRDRSLFHLLPAFRVSAFMGPVWNYFFHSGDSKLLTMALITNEQSLIEENILSKPASAAVLDTFKFMMQEKWGLTSILFPFKKRKYQKHYSVTGLTVSGFQSLQERIRTGKKLYHLLYSSRLVHESILAFCSMHHHTASRSDYWPHLYSASDHAFKLVSPVLEDSWPVIPQPKPYLSDWFLKNGLPKGFELPEQAKMQELTDKILSDALKLAPISAVGKKLFRV